MTTKELATSSEITKPPQGQAPDAAALPATKKEKHRTVGNRIYNWGVYTTFAWGGVAAASAASAHESQYGKSKYFNWLRSLNDNCIKGFSKVFTGITNSFGKGGSPEIIHKWAKGTTMFVTLGLGGWLMMAPIKWLEDNRQRNAARIDNALGTTPPDPETIEHEPKQTWHSVLSGRLFSWGVSYAAFVAMGPTLAGKWNDKISGVASRVWMALRPSSNPVKVKKWADIAAFDALFTVITAGVTYLWSRRIAKKDEEKEAVKPAPHLELATSDATVTSYAEKFKPMKNKLNTPQAQHTDKIMAGESQQALSL